MSELAPLAVQLYSLRDAIAQDMPAVINRLAEIGYMGVEPFGGLDHPAVARLCRESGLQVPSAHLPMPLGDAKNATLEAAHAYGIKRIIVPWAPPENFQTAEAIRRFSDRLVEASDIAAQNGLELGYHNHDFEFVPVEGRPAYHIFLEQLPPEIFLEVDVYWAQTAGVDVVELIRDLGARAPLLHIKDGPAALGQPMTALGEGVVNVPAIVHASAAAEWLIVELDACATDMMAAIEKSFHYMLKENLAHGR